jgi:hypothetical protein
MLVHDDGHVEIAGPRRAKLVGRRSVLPEAAAV